MNIFFQIGELDVPNGHAFPEFIPMKGMFFISREKAEEMIVKLSSKFISKELVEYHYDYTSDNEEQHPVVVNYLSKDCFTVLTCSFNDLQSIDTLPF